MTLSAWVDASGVLLRQPTAYAVLQAFVVAITVLFIHRLATKPKPYKLFPVWATLEVALTSYLVSENGLGRRILSALRRNDGSLFGLFSKHQILVDLPHVDRLLSHSSGSLDVSLVQYTLCTRVFGGVDSIELKRKFDSSWMDLRAPIEKLFLNDAAATAALERACIPEQVKAFVTFSSDRRNMKRWERSANIQLREPANSEDIPKVEANLQSLVRDFGASIAIPQLYGRDFFDRYTQVLDDFWKFDNDLFPLLMAGMPKWAPLKIVKEGLAAQTRIISEIEALYRRINQYQHGRSIDFNADMSDVSIPALERSKIYERDGWSFPERGANDLGFIWGQNANTQPVLFWLLTYVYSTSGLLEQLREEIAPYIRLSDTTPRELMSLDIQGLSKNCQLLKACIFETYRLVNEPTSIRFVSHSITIPDGDLKHELKPGMFVSAPHSLWNRDASVYDNPNMFNPVRFLEPNSSSGKPVARYGRLRPWGSGAAICKGRTFAEKEILTLGAAIISMWDIAPANGAWELPAMLPGTGVRRPVKDVRVLITRIPL